MASEQRMATADASHPALPLADSGKPPPDAARRGPFQRASPARRLMVVVAALLVVFLILLLVQPSAIRALLAGTGLGSGDGAARSPAVSANAAAPSTPVVVALGRLLPKGDTITLAPPFGAGDARITAILVEEGQWVEAGAVVALLDSLPQLEAAAASAAATIAVHEAELAQARSDTRASQREATASRDRAAAALRLAEAELERARDLHGRGVTTRALLDQAEAAADEAARELERTIAALSRYDGAETDRQPAIVLAGARLTAATADLARARADLAEGRVVAATSGTIIAINAEIGERPGDEGIATLGNTRQMTVELEVYQTDIRRVAEGQPVMIEAQALGPEPLAGRVTGIGLEVERQALIADDPAANTDARVILVTVTLDAASSARAASLTGLEVVGRIEAGGTT